MTATASPDSASAGFSLLELMPQVTCTLLRITGPDRDVALARLHSFLGECLRDCGGANDAVILFEEDGSRDETLTEVLRAHGVEWVLCAARGVFRDPPWAGADSPRQNVENQLLVALAADDLVALVGKVPTDAQLRRWIDKGLAPFRFVDPDVLLSTFDGRGRMVWMRGVQARRVTKPDSKVLGGQDVKQVLNPLDDGSMALSSARLDFQPEDEDARLRDNVIVTPDESRISWRRAASMVDLIGIVAEVFDLLRKALAGSEPGQPFPMLATRERDLTRVRDAYAVLLPASGVLETEPGTDDSLVERVERLLDVVLDVRPRQGAAVEVDVGFGGACCGTLLLTPRPGPGGLALDVGIVAETHPADLREIRSALGDGDLFEVHYESGHVYRNGTVYRESLVTVPFRNFDWRDFGVFDVATEKPKITRGGLQASIGEDGDRSLFAWVVENFRQGWLLCDDGAGEVADFLHLDDKGTLRVIHVKPAHTRSTGRGVAAARYEQVISQALKNLGFVDDDRLIEELTSRKRPPRAWHDGAASTAAEFIDRLATRVRSDETYVLIVQPHLRESVHDAARAAVDAGKVTKDSANLALLDTLLLGAQRTVQTRCTDLRVIGCAG
ncbi:hypothetical protein [Actinokineospora bangkokensis]|uniref:Uncharacterized protein n=1 Tax=Actinokineospora bangkokensis TaxID=1193682 RepID=A0A1Q9LJC7_9PSEU|nr:hypothetical protein [Actinokineospora bangkokensis]OLR92151.1 hypothetical protein BJP25_22715 [Actinokineospora bangkokensis]